MVGQELGRTAAERAAGGNWEANRRALVECQAELVRALDDVSLDVEWVFGRDEALTARTEGQWWGGCSLPRRTARVLLKRMELGAAVSCFLAPSHAAQLRETLDRLATGKALVAVVPDLRDLRVMLGCETFEDDLRAGRLWFAWGERWADEFSRLLWENEGLPTPGQFIRTGLAEEGVIQEMITAAQELISREGARRADEIRRIYATAAPTGAVCAVAPGAFRLWEDVGGVIGAIARRDGWRVLDPDDPRQASPLAFARAAAGCAAVVMSNVGRSDLPADFPARTRVVTWLTGPRVPRFDAKGAGDVLLIADDRWRRTAAEAGWPGGRVLVAGWPVERRTTAGSGLGVIADTVDVEAPEFDLSSHKVLWDTIAKELTDDPFATGDDPAAYLRRWLGRAGIAEETVNARLFVERLIVPAYQHGLVRWLLQAGLDVKLFGRGWDRLAEFASRHVGEVANRQSLVAAVESCAALVHAWPVGGAHAIDASGRPVLRRGSRSKELWLAEARRLGRGEGRIPSDTGAALGADVLRRAISLP
jgi:hypothetical protein